MSTMAIARKEWREIVRDRRSLWSGLFYGIWGPMVMGIALLAMARHQGPLGPITIGAQGLDAAPSLRGFLTSREVSVEPVVDGAAAVRSQRFDAVLAVDPAYAERVSSSRPAAVALLFNSTRPGSSRQATHLRSILADYRRIIADTRLVARGIAPAAAMPLRILERDYATAGDRAGRAFAMLPLFLLLAAFIGGMGVAADVTAGERERGSLESLLIHPISRESIVAGKWLAVSAAALATVALATAMSYLVLQHPRLATLDLPIGMNGSDAMTLLVILTPLAAAASALQLFMAIRTRTYKEAQTQLSMLIFVPMIPGFLIAFGSVSPAPWMAFVPMIGQHMLITDLARGVTPSLPAAAALSALTVAAGMAAAWAATRQLDREAVLRRAGA
jgi:sodium transport system permease protein